MCKSYKDHIKVTLGNMRFTTKPAGGIVGELQNELKRLGTTDILPLELLYACEW